MFCWLKRQTRYYRTVAIFTFFFFTPVPRKYVPKTISMFPHEYFKIHDFFVSSHFVSSNAIALVFDHLPCSNEHHS